MVVVDSSALIPLARDGRLDLVDAEFDDVRTVDAVREEVLVEGERGAAALASFLEDVTVEATPADADAMAELEGIAVADAAVIELAVERDEPLLVNDKALIEVGRSQGVDCWWVTSLLLSAVDKGTMTADDVTDVLYELVDEGMNLHPQVYARVESKLRELGD